MSGEAIRAAGLGKRFRLPQDRSSFPTLRDAVTASARRAFRALRRGARTPPTRASTFWALRDVSFDVTAGEVVGIIGGNGAGKSTLLKILSRITPPTEGRAEICGRIGSLLEVGTGFHPELSGRENVFLNGAILGMTRGEIVRQFDEIVAFAEVDRFINMPVKHYSSGMYLRLAFAVAAHLEAEILLVDEALAVGDAAFQKRCLGRMGDVARAGRTVLFVSHDIDAIERLCARCVLLDQGRIAADGPTADVVGRYLSRQSHSGRPGTWLDQTNAARQGSGEIRILAARHDGDAAAAGRVVTGGEWRVRCVVESDAARALSSFAVTVYSRSGAKLVNADTVELGRSVDLGTGRTTFGLRIDALHLNPGHYVVGLWLGDFAGHAIDHVPDAFELEVTQPRSPAFGISAHGLVACAFDLLPPTTDASLQDPRA